MLRLNDVYLAVLTVYIIFVYLMLNNYKCHFQIFNSVRLCHVESLVTLENAKFYNLYTLSIT